jgi:peptide/nickel transport system permease protein
MSAPVEHVAAPVAVEPAAPPSRVRARRLRLAFRSPTFVIGAVIVGFWVLSAIFGSSLVPKDPFFTDPLNKNLAPSAENWFGTDRLGRDVFARTIVGARDLLLIAPAATILGTVGGTVLGLVIGYTRKWYGAVLERATDAGLALPFLLVALTIIAARGSSNLTVIIAIGIAFTPIIARTVRAAVLVEREKDYVHAAQLRGERAPYVMFAEILPNILGPIFVEFTVRLGYAIFAASTLSFLGAGVQPPSPDWGLAVFENRSFLDPFWWPVVFPSVAIASLVIGINLIADALTEGDA